MVKKAKAKKTKPATVGLQRGNNGKKKLGGVTGKGFMPGQSGNPSGRRRASVSPTAALKRCLTRADAETIAETLIARAKAGDATAVKLLLDRIDGPQNGPLAVAMASAASTTDTSAAEVIICEWPHERTPGTKATVVLMDNHRGDGPNGHYALPDATPAPANETEPEANESELPGVISGAEFLADN